MRNRDKYITEILDIALNMENVAVNKKTGKPVVCRQSYCDQCLFDTEKSCFTALKEWGEAKCDDGDDKGSGTYD